MDKYQALEEIAKLPRREAVTSECYAPKDKTWNGKHSAVFDGESIVCAACNVPVDVGR